MELLFAIKAFFKALAIGMGLVRDEKLRQSGVDKANLYAMQAAARRKKEADAARRDSDADGGRLRPEDYRDD